MTLSSPQQVTARLEAIDADLAVLQNEIEAAAFDWFRAKHKREQARAEAYLRAEGSIEARKAIADVQTACQAMEEEALWEAKKAKLRTLEGRLGVGQSILRSQGRS
jgi:uncharacterized SAM-dependent methyltransferase